MLLLVAHSHCPFTENPYARIDIRNIRLDDTAQDKKEKSINYLTSETFFAEVCRHCLFCNRVSIDHAANPIWLNTTCLSALRCSVSILTHE